MKIGIVIPIFNVEKTIVKVLSSLSRSIQNHDLNILLIDNRSTDKTRELISQFLSENLLLAEKVTLISHKMNYGYGASVKAGMDYFLKCSMPYVMVLHGDDQVDPSWLIDRLVTSLKENQNIDLILASRFMPESGIENYSLLRKLGNYFFNFVTIFCTGFRMSDSGAAMIIVRRETLQKVPFRTLSNSWQFHPQLNIFLYGLPEIRIKEIPMNWADSEAPSTVPLIRYSLALLKMLLQYRFKKTFPEDAFIKREYFVCTEWDKYSSSETRNENLIL